MNSQCITPQNDTRRGSPCDCQGNRKGYPYELRNGSVAAIKTNGRTGGAAYVRELLFRFGPEDQPQNKSE